MYIFFVMGYSFFTLIPPSFTPGSSLSQLTSPTLQVQVYLSYNPSYTPGSSLSQLTPPILQVPVYLSYPPPILRVPVYLS